MDVGGPEATLREELMNAMTRLASLEQHESVAWKGKETKVEYSFRCFLFFFEVLFLFNAIFCLYVYYFVYIYMCVCVHCIELKLSPRRL